MKSKLNNIEIKICFSVLKLMERYIQDGAKSLEAGGVLIGKENISNNNIIIKYITEPYVGDKRKYNRFIRKDKKHIDIFKEIYKSGNGIYRYIGEWHTHDESVPNYSSVDLKNWIRIIKESPDNMENFHIIVGSKAIRIWKYSKLLKTPVLIETIYWKDVMDSNEEICEDNCR